ncbi:MAG: class II aldolase/adducin family protein, partial [Thermoleophilia bacterium]
ELAEGVRRALRGEGDLAAVLLASHGAVLVGADERDALELAEALEDVCRLVVLAGERARLLDEAELPRLRELFRAYRGR